MSTQAADRLGVGQSELGLGGNQGLDPDDLARDQILFQPPNLLGQLAERGPFGVRNRLGRLVPSLESGGIDLASVIDDLEVEMRPGRVSGGSDISHQVTLADTRAPTQARGESLEVAVERLDAGERAHVAEDGDFDLAAFPRIRDWLRRVAGEPGHVDLDWRP